MKNLIALCLALTCSTAIKAQAQIIALQTENAPQAIGPYSQAIKVVGVREAIFTSGQLPINPQTGELIQEPAEATRQCMKNLAAILTEGGMDFSNVIDTIILLRDINDFAAVNGAYAEFLEQPYPARATFQVAVLPKNAVIEIKMIAVK